MSTLTQLQTLINAIGDGENNTAEEVRAILNALSTSCYLTGDIKEIDCTNAYIIANFDATGLGINERVGWAICNGLNGTKDRNGRVGVAYGTAYPVMGATGGSKDAVVVAHTHGIATSPNDALGYVTVKTSSSSGGTAINTASAGESGTNKNMQPYIVTLVIQKL